jgi:hypothetical protein
LHDLFHWCVLKRRRVPVTLAVPVPTVTISLLAVLCLGSAMSTSSFPSRPSLPACTGTAFSSVLFSSVPKFEHRHSGYRDQHQGAYFFDKLIIIKNPPKPGPVLSGVCLQAKRTHVVLRMSAISLRLSQAVLHPWHLRMRPKLSWATLT